MTDIAYYEEIDTKNRKNLVKNVNFGNQASNVECLQALNRTGNSIIGVLSGCFLHILLDTFTQS